jgi:hypothetical protein
MSLVNSGSGLKEVSLSSTNTNKANITFELPDDISDDDEVLLTNVLTAMYAGDFCSSYKIHTTPNGYLIRGSISNDDSFEIELDDLQFITHVNPIRIERVAICKRGGGNAELVVKILNCKQRVMIATSTTFTATKKRKYTPFSAT